MKTKLLVGTAVAGLMLSALSIGAGTAFAEPDIEPIVNTTCTFEQVDAALGAEAPEVAGELHASPLATWWVQNMINSAPDQRRGMIAQVQGLPEIEQYGPAISHVATTCQNY